MKLFAKSTEVTLDYILGVMTEVNDLGVYVEVKDSIFYFSQAQEDYGKDIRFTKVINFH